NYFYQFNFGVATNMGGQKRAEPYVALTTSSTFTNSILNVRLRIRPGHAGAPWDWDSNGWQQNQPDGTQGHTLTAGVSDLPAPINRARLYPISGVMSGRATLYGMH